MVGLRPLDRLGILGTSAFRVAPNFQNHMKLKLLLFSISWMCVGALTAPAQVALNPRPSRELGHAAAAFNPLNPVPSSVNPNLVEGRELYAPAGVAMDTGVSPPIVYVSDSGNNRILGWNYTGTLGNPASGAFPTADIIIGQNDRYSALASNSQTNSNGMNSPSGIAVDNNGNLYVVDSGNNRVLRFPRGTRNPDMVIGQPSPN